MLGLNYVVNPTRPICESEERPHCRQTRNTQHIEGAQTGVTE